MVVMKSIVIKLVILYFLISISLGESPSVWRNHGKDLLNSRHQDSNLLSKLTYEQLSLIRTYFWENITSSFPPQGYVSCTPSIWGNTLYYTDHSGNLLAYNKLDGSEVYWEYVPNLLFTTSRPNAYSRSTPSLDGAYLFLGTTDASITSTGLFPGPTVIRIDRDTGLNEIVRNLTPDPTQIITMSGTSFDDTYFVGLSTQQSLYALTVPNFQCCSAVGKFYKLDSDLNILWSFDTISSNLPIGPNGYSGASVWGSSPVIVETEEIVYITTGQNHNLPSYIKDCLLENPNDSMRCWEEGNYADSIIALNYTSGELIWHYTTRVDAWNAACLDPQSPNYYNCPQPTGPDGDFGMDVIYIKSQYEECEKVCECASEIVHENYKMNLKDTNIFTDGVDKILSLITEFFTSDNTDGKSTSNTITVNNNNNNNENHNSIENNTIKSIRTNPFSGKVREYELSFHSSVSNKNCNYFPCYKQDYDCTTCYPFTDAKPYTIVSTRGLYIFDSIATGNIALTPSSNLYGVPPTIVNGNIDINNSQAMAAHEDMITAYNTISNCTCDFVIDGDVDMNGGLFTPGVYCINGNGWLNSTLLLPFVNPGGLEYTFILSGNLTFYPGASIEIENEITPCNINWIANRIVGERNTQLFGNFFSRDDIVLFMSDVFGKLFTIDGPIVSYESTLNPCECRYIPVSPTPSTSSTPTSSSSNSPIPSASPSPSSSVSMIPSSSSSPSSSPTSLPSSSSSPTVTPIIPCGVCPDLSSETLSMAILGGSGVSNVGLSVITGDVASSTPITGFPPGVIVGSIDINNAVYLTSRNEITLAYNEYVNCQCESQGNVVLENAVLTEGSYCYDRLTLKGTITFDTLFNPDGIFVIKANNIIIDNGTIMSIIGDGIIGCNVVIVSRDDIQIGVFTTLVGTMISQNDITYNVPPIPILQQNILTGHLYSINGNVNLWNVLQTVCSCTENQSPSMSPTPFPSVSPSSSATLSNQCDKCPRVNQVSQSYGILGALGIINDGPSQINSNVASSVAINGFPPGIITGSININNANYVSVLNEALLTYNQYVNCPCQSQGNISLTSRILTPGVYCYDRLTLGRNIVFDSRPNPNGVFLFVVDQLVIDDLTTMTIIGDGTTILGCNVIFISTSSISIGFSTNLVGTYIARTDITYNSLAPVGSINNLRGHLFSTNGKVQPVNLNQSNCGCTHITPTQSSTPTRSVSPSISVTPTQTCTCTPTPTPQKKCDCHCDMQGNTHVPKYNMVLAADKSGMAYGLNALTGEEIWKTSIGPGGYLGGSSWGGTTDGKRYVYYNIINNQHKEWMLTPSNELTTSGGWVKVDVWTGDIVWSVRVPEDPMNEVQELWATGPPTLVNDLLVTTSVNGHLYLIDTMNGDILWNEHIAKTIYGGVSADNTNCIYVGSGYNFQGLLEDNRVFQFCIGDPISYSVDVESMN